MNDLKIFDNKAVTFDGITVTLPPSYQRQYAGTKHSAEFVKWLKKWGPILMSTEGAGLIGVSTKTWVKLLKQYDVEQGTRKERMKLFIGYNNKQKMTDDKHAILMENLKKGSMSGKNKGRRGAKDERRKVGDERREVGDERQEMKDERQEVRDERQEVRDERQEVRDERQKKSKVELEEPKAVCIGRKCICKQKGMCKEKRTGDTCMYDLSERHINNLKIK